MSFTLTVLWIAIISVFGLGGALYAKRYGRPDALTAFYVTLVVFANIASSKTIAFDLGVLGTFFAPAAVLIFSVTFLLTDIVNERFGKAETRRMIAIALAAQAALVLFSYLIVHARPAPFFADQAAFANLFGTVPRLVTASIIAFFISENLDTELFQWFRKLTGGRHLWARNALSSIPSMLVDSVLFVTIAFWGVMPIVPLIVGLTLTKWLVGIVDIPFMYLARHIMHEAAAQSGKKEVTEHGAV